MGPELLPDVAEILFAAVRGSRLVIVTVETTGMTTGVYALCGVLALGASRFDEEVDSMTGEAGDSKVGEAGESSVGEAGDSTMVKGESMMRLDDVSMSGESGGARRGESSPADFLQRE